MTLELFKETCDFIFQKKFLNTTGSDKEGESETGTFP